MRVCELECDWLRETEIVFAACVHDDDDDNDDKARKKKFANAKMLNDLLFIAKSCTENWTPLFKMLAYDQSYQKSHKLKGIHN